MDIKYDLQRSQTIKYRLPDKKRNASINTLIVWNFLENYLESNKLIASQNKTGVSYQCHGVGFLSVVKTFFITDKNCNPIECQFHLTGENKLFIRAQGFRFFSRLVGRRDPWSKNWWAIFWNDGPTHIKLTTVDIWVVHFTYILTHTATQKED